MTVYTKADAAYIPFAWMNPELAVILPVYAGDHPDYLREALESIVRQSLQNFILVVVEDGPLPEAITQVLNEYKDEMQLLQHSQNQGLATALNTALDWCEQYKISFLARMDADDRMRPERLEMQLDFLNLHEEVDVVGCALEEMDTQGRPRGKQVFYPENHHECLRFFRFRDPLPHPGVMFRMRFFQKAGRYDPGLRYNQDTELWYRGFLNGAVFANLPAVLLEFRMTEAFFATRRAGKARARQLLALRKEINKGLGFGPEARLFARGMFLLALLPAGIRKLAYRIFR